MGIYANGPTVGPDGSFVDKGSLIPDVWVADFGDWVDDRVERGDFVEQDEPPARSGLVQATPLDAEAHLNTDRRAEATQ